LQQHLLVHHSRQRFIGDINELQCAIGRLAGFGDHQRDAFPDKTNPIHGHYRAVRHYGTGNDPVGLDVSDFSAEIGAI
jgi:hypothetical protein